MKGRAVCAVVLLLVAGLSALAVMASAQSSPKYGGKMTLAMEGEVPTLDLHWSALNTIRNIAYHINEQLFDYNADYIPTPMLATGYSLDPSGTVYTIGLRQGVYFHNGKELTADDVVASLRRWIGRSTVGRQVSHAVASIEAAGKYEIVITLTERMGFLIEALTVQRQGAAIYPKEVIEAAGEGQIKEFIGTGPYRFVRWEPGSYILLERYEDYAPLETPASGFSGRKMAYLDQLQFMFVSESSVRAVGVQAGDYQYAWTLPSTDYDRLKADPNIVISRPAPKMMAVLLNAGDGPTADRKVRQAILAAIDCEEILTGVFGPEQFWRLDSGIMWQETAWWTDAGAPRYNQANPELAKQLLAEAGYDGTPIRLIVSAPQKIIYDGAVILQEQLKAIGLNVEFVSYDVATHRDVKANKPEMWEVDLMWSTYRTHPTFHIHLDKNWDGQWYNPAKEVLVAELLREEDQAKALEIWRAIELLYYDDVPIVKIGDFYDIDAMRKEVHGFVNFPEPFFWNVWLEG